MINATVGDLAYLDTLCFGLVPCKVMSMTGTYQPGNDTRRLTVRVTASRGPFATYRRGEMIEYGPTTVVPRAAVQRARRWCGQYMIRPYTWPNSAD